MYTKKVLLAVATAMVILLGFGVPRRPHLGTSVNKGKK
jgi:hypothetical protein